MLSAVKDGLFHPVKNSLRNDACTCASNTPKRLTALTNSTNESGCIPLLAAIVRETKLLKLFVTSEDTWALPAKD